MDELPREKATRRHSMNTLRNKKIQVQSGRAFRIKIQRVGNLRLQVVDAASQEPLAGLAYTLSQAKVEPVSGSLDGEGRAEHKKLRAGMWQLRLQLDPKKAPPPLEEEPAAQPAGPAEGETRVEAGVQVQAPDLFAEAKVRTGGSCRVAVRPWIVSAQLVDDQGTPLPAGPVRVQLESGAQLEGNLAADGNLLLGPAEEGVCRIDLDDDGHSDVGVAAVHWAAQSVRARVPPRLIAQDALPAGLLDVPEVDWKSL